MKRPAPEDLPDLHIESKGDDRRMFKVLLAAASTDQSRPILTGAWTDESYIWATNSYVLVRYNKPLDWPAGLRFERAAMKLLAAIKGPWTYRTVIGGHWHLDSPMGDIRWYGGPLTQGDPPSTMSLWRAAADGPALDNPYALGPAGISLVMALDKLRVSPVLLPPTKQASTWRLRGDNFEGLIMGVRT